MHGRTSLGLHAVATLGVGLSLLAGVAAATTTDPAPPPPSAAVDDGPGDQTDPHISGTLVSYTSEEGGGSQIRWADLATGARGTVPNAGEFDYLGAVSGSRIAYTRITDRSVVHVLDLGTGVDVAIDDAATTNDRAPSIGGTTVALQRVGDPFTETEIVVHDLATGVTTRLSDDDVLDKNPDVSPDGSVVVWTKCVSLATGCDIWKAVRGPSGWVVSQVSGVGEESLPSTDGERIAYASARPVADGTEQDIEVVPVAGGPVVRLDRPGSVQRNPNIADGIVSFEDFELSTLNYDLFVWEVDVDQVRRLAQTPVDESLNGLSVAPDGTVRVVWTVNEGTTNGFDVFSTSFARVPTTPPALTVAVQQPVDADGSSTFNARRGVVPLTFTLRDGGVPTCTLPPARLAVTRLGSAPTVVDEAVYATPSDEGSSFRVDGCQYRYNLAARSLGPGRYRVDVLVSGAVVGGATFALA